MSRMGLFFLSLGFLAAWPIPVVGAPLMVVGAIIVAIASEAAMVPVRSGKARRASAPSESPALDATLTRR
jgi:hypothetical protein